jgi:hypothetical protein
MKKIFLHIFILLFSTIPMIFAQEYFPNSVTLGIGFGNNLNHSGTEFTLLGGYDRHFEGTPEFSVGAFVEGVFGEETYCVLGLPIGFYPIDEMKLWIAPCFTLNGGGKKYYQGNDGVPYFHSNNEFMLKFGAGYVIPLQGSRWTAMPYLEGSVVNSQFILGLGVKMNLYFADPY